MKYQIVLTFFVTVIFLTISAADVLAQDEPKVTIEQLQSRDRAAVALRYAEQPTQARWVFSHASVAKSMKCSDCHRVDDSLHFQRMAWDLRYEVSGLTVSANPLGIHATSLSPEFAGYLGLNQSAAVAREVPENSPAYQAGLRQFDVMLSLNDTKLESPSQFDELVTAQAGKQIVLTVLRRGEQKQIELSVPAVVATNKTWSALLQQPEVQTSSYKLGVMLAEVDEVLHSHLNLPKGEGILVTEITKEGPADRIGCEVNDIFLAIDEKPITGQDQLRKLVQEIGDREVALKLVRRGKSIETKIKPILMNHAENTNDYYSLGLLDARSIENVKDQSKYFEAIIGNQPNSTQNDSKPTETVTQIQKVKATVAELQAKMAEVLVELEVIEAKESKKQTP